VAPDLDNPSILAIGDGVKTDILGAVGEDIDSLFITGGLAAEETATELHPHEELLLEFLAREGVTPTYSIGFLR